MTERPNDDQDLREAFAAARRADAERVPPYRRVRRGNLAAGPHRVRLWPAVAMGAVLAAAGILVFRRHVEDPAVMLQRIGPLRSATDFLLDVNGAEFLKTVPTIGDAEGWFPVTRTSEGQRL